MLNLKAKIREIVHKNKLCDLIAKRKRIANRNGKTKTSSLWQICHSNYRNKK